MIAPLPVRELYAVAHFGNGYEVALPREMTAILAEARFWGFNRFLDRFDTMDLYDLYHKQHRLFNLQRPCGSGSSHTTPSPTNSVTNWRL